MSRAPAAAADWHQSLGPGARRREALAWTGAALSVALVATATAALAMRLDSPQGREETEAVVFLDLTPEPPPAAAALPDFAPETPMTELPETLQPDAPPEAEPDLATPPDTSPPDTLPDTRPPTALARLPDTALPPDSFTPAPPPSPPEATPEPAPEPELAQIPAIRPQPRPERVPEPQAEPEPQPEPAKEAPAAHERTKAAAKPPSPARTQATAAAPAPASAARSQGQTALPQGRLDDLTAAWGNKIRSKIQKRAVAPRGVATRSHRVEIRVVVRPDGRLAGAQLITSSGDAALDAAATKAVRAAGRFPAAPRQLTEASYSFLVPIRFEATKTRG